MQPSCSEIGFELHEVNVSKCFNSLQFHNDLIGHYKINSGSAHHLTLEAHIHGELGLVRYRPMR